MGKAVSARPPNILRSWAALQARRWHHKVVSRAFELPRCPHFKAGFIHAAGIRWDREGKRREQAILRRIPPRWHLISGFAELTVNLVEAFDKEYRNEFPRC